MSAAPEPRNSKRRCGHFDFKSCRVLITGSSAGIGKAIARQLYAQGAHVVVSGRDAARCEATCQNIQAMESASNNGGSIAALPMDLADFASVRDAAASLNEKPLNLLILNAGMLYHANYTGPWMSTSGHDYMFAANHLGHFLLTLLLLPNLKASGCPTSPSKIVHMASIAHWAAQTDELCKETPLEHVKNDDIRFRKSYARSKLANIPFAHELQRRMSVEGAPVIAVAVAPGLVKTEIFSNVRGRDNAYESDAPKELVVNAVDPEQGAETAIYAATLNSSLPCGTWILPYWSPFCYDDCISDELIWASEVFFEAKQKLAWGIQHRLSSPVSRDMQVAGDLWQYSVKAVGLESSTV